MLASIFEEVLCRDDDSLELGGSHFLEKKTGSNIKEHLMDHQRSLPTAVSSRNSTAGAINKEKVGLIKVQFLPLSVHSH